MAGVGNEAAGTLTVRWVVGIETGASTLKRLTLGQLVDDLALAIA